MSNRYLLKNLIRLVSIKQFNDLSTIDFSDLDLREVELYKYTFVNGSRKSNFKNARISEKTFLQEYHKKMISNIVYSFDGAFYASSSYDYTVKIWDSETNLCVQALKTHEQLSMIRFSIDGNLLI